MYEVGVHFGNYQYDPTYYLKNKRGNARIWCAFWQEFKLQILANSRFNLTDGTTFLYALLRKKAGQLAMSASPIPRM